MAREVDKLVTVIEVDDKGSVKIRGATKDVEKYGEQGRKAFGSLKTSYLAATAALAGFVAVANKVVKLAAEQERVERRLSFAVSQTT